MRINPKAVSAAGVGGVLALPLADLCFRLGLYVTAIGTCILALVAIIFVISEIVND